MREAERSVGAFWTALLTVALLAGALLVPWFSYDFSSGRQTAPDGPFSDDPMVERDHVDFYAFRVEGNIEPSDPDAADMWMMIVGGATALAIVLLLFVVLGEIRDLRRLISRRAALALICVALALTIACLAIVWYAVPGTMEGQGVDDAFTHRLDEPDGYTRTGVDWAWVLAGLSLASAVGAWLFTFQAGSHDPALVEAYRAT